MIEIDTVTPSPSTILGHVDVTLRKDKLPILKTERLTLREITARDITDEYVNWLNNPDVNKYLEVRFCPQTRESLTEYIESKLKDTEKTKHFGIYETSSATLIGTVTLGNIELNHKTSDIAFVIGHPKAKNMGYATEAVHAVTHYSFTAGGLIKLYAGYYDGHEGSARVLAKNGYKVEGRIKKKYVNHEGQRVDHILVGILNDEYQQLRTKFA